MQIFGAGVVWSRTTIYLGEVRKNGEMAVETVRKSDFCTNCLTLALPPYPPPPKKKTEITHYISPFAVVLQTTVVSAFLKIGARACMFVRVRACVRACVRVCV